MNTEWTEETVRPYLFKEVQLSGDNRDWSSPTKLIGYDERSAMPFITALGSASYMRPIKAKKKIIKPWTQETCPWPLSVRMNGIDHLGGGKNSQGVSFCGGGGLFSYEELACEKQSNGEPCGVVEEVDE